MKIPMLFKSCVSALVILCSIDSFAQNGGNCMELFSKKVLKVDAIPAVSTDLGNINVMVENIGGRLHLEMSYITNSRSIDWTMAFIILSIAPLENVKRTDKVRGDIADPDGQWRLTFNSALKQLAPLIERYARPDSLKEVGDFDKLSRLETFQNSLGVYRDLAPNKFRTTYEAYFLMYTGKLPLALVAAMRTEFYLDSNPQQMQLAKNILQAAYGITENQAARALQLLRYNIVAVLEGAWDNIWGRRVIVHTRAEDYGLYAQELPVSLSYKPSFLVYKGPAWNTNKKFKYAPPDSTIPARNWELKDLDIYNFEKRNNNRTLMVDDLPPELIDMSTVALLHERYGIDTVADFAREITGPMMMYELGMTRNEIKDLYYYMRANHHVYLNLTDNFAITLGIFREEYHQRRTP